MKVIETLSNHPVIAPLLQRLAADAPEIVDLAIAIQQIPAPTFAEKERAQWVEDYLTNLGLSDIERDDLNNVYGRISGRDNALPPVIISAHTDTVFPIETDLSIRRELSRIHGPGLADNSTGVAGLLWLAKLLKEATIATERDIWFIANIAEEGLGDLIGMRRVVERFGAAATYIVIEGGSFGHIIHQGIGVNRFRIEVKATGGHSWADFGKSSAIHVLGTIIDKISQLRVPRNPKTSFNVGVISGGTSINTIAETAELLLDCRSEALESLQGLVKSVHQIVNSAANQPNVEVNITQIGNRPPGKLDRNHKLLQLATDAFWIASGRQPEYGASSTDANIPLSIGAPAVCIGLAHSGNIHRQNEFLDPTHLGKGMQQLLLLTLATAAK